MLNKRNKKYKSTLNPYKIASYNNFLLTLDQNSTNFQKKNKINSYFFHDVQPPVCINKNTRDLLFLDIAKIEENDPNIYKDFLSDSNICIFKRGPKSKKEIDFEKIDESQLILVNVECEIQTIADILSLINTYPLDPTVKYNIDMKSLHRIKEPLEDLNNMIGMKELKNNIVDQILYFVQYFHKGTSRDTNTTSGDFMHTVLYGPPGTGKTEVAKILGKIFCNLGVLEKNKFLKVTRSDLIAGYLGQTALKTRDIIKDALGGVLFIDEAYALGSPDKKDSFSKECIDTLCEALSNHKENLMVIIAGYEEELKHCFFQYNQGLDSRFTWRYKMDEYSANDLYCIFLKKIKEIGWTIENDIHVEWFHKNKDYFKSFGRDIETLVAKTKITHSKRVFCKLPEEKRKINLDDLEKGFKMYINNSEIKQKQEKEYLKKQLYSSIYC